MTSGTFGRLKRVQEGLWVAEQGLRMFPGATFSSRMTVMSITPPPTHGHNIPQEHLHLAVHSPIQITPSLKREIDAIGGTVAYVISPNKFHHLFARTFQRAYPDATFYAPEGLINKMQNYREKIPRYDFAITEHTNETMFSEQNWGKDLDFIKVRGMPMLEEMIFYHQPSATMVVTDLAFNFNKGFPLRENGIRFFESPLAYIYLNLIGGLSPKFQASKPFRWKPMAADRKLIVQSLERTRAWAPLNRIIMCHGEIIEGEEAANKAREEMISFFY